MSFNRNAILHEYMFQQAILSVNAGRYERGEQLITTSMARNIHMKLLEELKKLNPDASAETVMSVKPGDFRATVNTVLASYNGGKDVYEDGKNPAGPGRAMYDRQVGEVKSITGWGATGQTRNDGYIPLSPYDEQNARRYTFLNNGASLLYMKAEDEAKTPENVPLYSVNENGRYLNAGVYESPDDKSGLSMLAPYISKKDYTAVAAWVNGLDESKFMSQQAIQKSSDILRLLQEEGIGYTVECDDNVGQIRARINNTKMTVRLMDTKDNEQYIGRVYDDGVSIYYSTNAKYQDKDGKWLYSPYTADAREAVDLLHYMRGDTITRPDANVPVGTVSSYDYNKSNRNAAQKLQNTSYYTKQGFMAAVKPYNNRSDRFVFMKVVNNRSSASLRFTPESGQEFLQKAIASARKNYADMVGIDSLVQQAKEHGNDESYTPLYSGDAAIAAVQRVYWDILTKPDVLLMRPDVSENESQELVKEVYNMDMSESTREFLTSDMVYTGTPEEKVRQHLLDSLDAGIGTYELNADGKRFDSATVSRYMDSEFGIFRNNDNLLSAMKAVGISADELLGDDFYNQTMKDRMIEFNETTAKPMQSSANPFIRNMYDVIKDTLTGSGCTFEEKDILIDDAGIVRYRAKRTVGMAVSNSTQEDITGEIGQIFVPDDLGMVETHFAGTPNYIFVPGYEAAVVSGEGTLEERTRLKGYEQRMADSIRYNIRSGMMACKGDVDHVGSTTCLNDTYRGMYETRHDLDFMQQSYDNGMTPEILHDIIRTEACRVRYSNEFKENSTINADFKSNQVDNRDAVNDNFMDFYRLSGYRNMSIMTEDGDGYFDPIATATSTNQGITRYLVEGATVDFDGKIIPSADKDDRTPIMKNEVCKYMRFNPFDRQQMTFGNLMTASCVPRGVATAQMTFGGWNFDDGYVVSKRFADKYTQRDQEGELRSLVIGDKISDMNGNKGVISLIVDPDYCLDKIKSGIDSDSVDFTNGSDKDGSYREGTYYYAGRDFTVKLRNKPGVDDVTQAAELIQKAAGFEGCETALQWFSANSELDVVGAPFPAPSRFNGGSARELMETPMDLVAPDGTVHEGCMGRTTYIVTHMAVDAKSHVYDEVAMAEGRGRKASAQLAWALIAQNCVQLMAEYYGTNNGATSNLREYLITCGLDISETGELRMGYKPHPGENRNVFKIPELEYHSTSNKLDVKSMKMKFSNILSQQGGILEIPFPLKFPTGEETAPMNDTHTDVIYEEQEFERKGYTRKDGVYVRPTTVHKQVAVTQETQMYGLPVMSAYLRSGNELIDGSTVIHDYTNQYLRIYECALRYMDAHKKLHGATPEQQTALQMEMMEQQKIAQTDYDRITADVKNRAFTGKHNYFRDHIMSNKVPNSATMVWTADPRLNIDEIAMSKETAEALGLKENDHAVIWRDPILSDGGIRYLKVVINDELTGFAVNPAIDQSFEGDYDGDSVGGQNPMRIASKEEAMRYLSMEANLLNKEVPVDENGNYPLYVQDSLDLKSAQYVRPELTEQRKDMTDRVNEFERLYENGEISEKEVMQYRKEVVAELSDWMHDAMSHEFGTDMICFKDMPSHMASVEQMVIHKAKGNYAKLEDYAKYLGVTYQRTPENIDPEQKIALDSVVDTGDTRATRKDTKDVQYATAIKSFGTGIAGMYSQRGISAMRNLAPTEVLGLTHPVTQAILQAKHDPIQAAHQYGMLMGPCRDLWKGRMMELGTDRDGNQSWKVVKDPNTGAPLQADKERFIWQFETLYMDKTNGLGVEVNPEYIKKVADLFLDEKTGTMKNIEDYAKTEGAILDRLAYGGTFETLTNAAKNGTDLFEGKYSSMFMPSKIRDNIRAKAEDPTESKVKAIVKSDTKESFAPKSTTKKAVSVKVSVKKSTEPGIGIEETAAEPVDAKSMARQQPNFEKEGFDPNVMSSEAEAHSPAE